ncbi:aspartate aminotransferase family protein [Nesterenkonia rhizosphaerae]|uniref:Aspartate aminotransferase family protein n=1 Tax=Nesterenkonia rhizosphaerae TaxID=1348272 RepID=A0ABP9FYI7_9MICC
MTESLLSRRFATMGRHEPLFYNEPLHLVSAHGVWLTDISGRRYLDAYNNVPHVGHCHPRIVEALRSQASTLNIHTRYLNEHVVDYSEELLSRFEPSLNRVLLTNSGSEANDLAFRMAAQHTGARGILVTDHSYHGNTTLLAGITTGLRTHEPLAAHVRAFPVPDLDAAENRDRDEQEILQEALEQVQRAAEELVAAGHGVSAVIMETLFSTEGLPRVPEGFVTGVAETVRSAGGLVIADEVQSGLGRLGSHFWGYQKHGLIPDLVTLGKPLGNGHPVAGVVTTGDLLEEFGSRNEYFNTFGGNPVSAAVAHEVLRVIDEEQLTQRCAQLGDLVAQRMQQLVQAHPRLGAAKGSGLFFGLSVFADEDHRQPDGASAKALVESVKEAGVLLSRIGPSGSVLKIRPPLALSQQELPVLLEAVEQAVGNVLQAP